MFMIKYADFYSRGLNLCFKQVKKIVESVNPHAFISNSIMSSKEDSIPFFLCLFLVGTHALFPT